MSGRASVVSALSVQELLVFRTGDLEADSASSDFSRTAADLFAGSSVELEAWRTLDSSAHVVDQVVVSRTVLGGLDHCVVDGGGGSGGGGGVVASSSHSLVTSRASLQNSDSLSLADVVVSGETFRTVLDASDILVVAPSSRASELVKDTLVAGSRIVEGSMILVGSTSG